jgi:predicted ATPase
MTFLVNYAGRLPEGPRGYTMGGEIAASEVVRSLANLVTKSLVTMEAGSVIAHHRLHETTRVYALEKLDESGRGELLAVGRQ